MFTALLAAWVLAVPVTQQDPGAELRARMEGIARAAIADNDLPGLSVHVTSADGTLLSRGFGYLDAAERTVESVDASRFAEPLAERLIAVALLAQVEQGKAALEQPLVEHFPKLTFEGRKVRVGQLLTHTSGVPSYLDWARGRQEPIDSAAVVAWLETSGVEAEPGTCFLYSESNTLLAGLLVQKLAGKELSVVLQASVIEPLGLDDTSFSELPKATEASARRVSGAREVPSPSELLGLAQLRSTSLDLEHFVRDAGAGKLVGGVGLRALTEPLRLEGEDAPYTHGFARTVLGRNVCLSFGAPTPHGSLHVAWYPDLGLVLALASGAETELLPAVGRRMARAVLDLPEPGIVDLPLSREQRAPYLGGYYIGCTRVTIEERGELLEFNSPYGERYRLRYQGHERFVTAEDPEIIFEFKLEHGRAMSFVLTQRGTQTTGKRMD